jgi:hypothetical protein
VDGKLRWVHSASTEKYSLITVHDKRGTVGMDAAGVLPADGGIAVHDAWAPYDTYRAIAGHQLCCAHALRELQAVQDATPAGQWCWAQQAASTLSTMKHLTDTSLATDGTLNHVDAQAMAKVKNWFTSAVAIGRHDTATGPDALSAKHHALAARLAARQDDYLRFTQDPRIPFDNNAAEREIRMIKLRQKVSGCLRTMTGAEQFCAIRSYLATTIKNGKHTLESLTNLFQGHPWLPQTARAPT